MTSESKSNASKLLLAGIAAGAGLMVSGGVQSNAQADSVKVQENDTIWSLSQKLGISMQSLESLNNVNHDSHMIYVGQDIQVPSKSTTYVVKSGESLSTIASKFGVSVNDLINANHLSGSLIYVGQSLIIPTQGQVENTYVPKAAPVQVQQASSAAPVQAQQQVVASSAATSAAPVQQASSAAPVVQAQQQVVASSAATSVAPVQQASSAEPVQAQQQAVASSAAVSAAPVQQASSAAPVQAQQQVVASSAAVSAAPVQQASSAAPVQAQQQVVASSAATLVAPVQQASSAAPVQAQQQVVASSAATSVAPVQQASSAAPVQAQQQVAPKAAPVQHTAPVQRQQVATPAPAPKPQNNVAAVANNGSVTGLAKSLANNTIPYTWGGKTPSGFDCSGFVSYVYNKAAGKSLPGYTVAMESYANSKPVSNAQPGDLLFWGNHGSTYHVGIYLGNNQYASAPTFGQNVKVQNVSPYFAPSFAASVK